MTRVRNVGGLITEYTGGNEIIYAKGSIDYNATGPISFTSDTALNFSKPKTPPAGKYFIKGWWTDIKDKPIKEAHVGDTVRFHIKTKDIPDGEFVLFSVFDWDGMLNPDDKFSVVHTGTSTEYNKIKITGNKGVIEFKTGLGSVKMIEEEGDTEIELYVKCTYKTETVDLPDFSDDYLILFEKEVLITVLIELPHSSYSTMNGIMNLDVNEVFSAKGLAGHSAMAIGERYFDYGPNQNPGKYDEKEYDADFNKDGDKNDIVQLDSPSFKDSPGMPWWGSHIAERKKISPSDVKLKDVIDYIGLHWRIEGTGIYGEVNKIEFYVKESEAKKMILWWEERYKHLKVYSVFPWTGEQCTTTVKTAIQQAFPLKMFGPSVNYIMDETQKPSGLLSELKKFISTSRQNKGKSAIVKVIKKQSVDYP